ncbi:MAG: hypothetical protein Q4D61_06430 [Cardiobacteriaceae bacterium]|nr:hypothetical protein [Cardiobacteriaceae bacterium]
MRRSALALLPLVALAAHAVTQIAPPAPENGLPPRAGQTLTMRPGLYQDGQITGSYWLRNTRRIADAATRHYTPSQQDIDNALTYIEEVRGHDGHIRTFKSKALIVQSASAPAPRPFVRNQPAHGTAHLAPLPTIGRAPSATPIATNAKPRPAARHRLDENDICHTISQQHPRIPGGARLDPLPDTPRPPLRQAIATPHYHSCLVRVSDSESDGIPLRNTYSRRQAFNADNSRFLLFARNGHWHLFDAKTAQPVKTLPHIAGDAEPQWHTSNPNLLYYLPVNGVGMTLHELNTDNGTTRTIADFNTRLKAHWPAAHNAWTRWEGSPSADNRYWCFMVENQQFQTLGIFTWDMQQDRILALRDLGGEDPDHVSMSPSGDYCIVSGQTTRAYPRNLQGDPIPLHHTSEHSDLALDAHGDDIYVSVDYQSHKGDVFMTHLKSGKKTPLFQLYDNGSSTALHFSGKNYDKPGWILISTYAETPDRNGKRQWTHRKIFAVSLEPSPRIRNISYAHSTGGQGWHYWAEPQATVSRDFSRILFNSDWGSGKESDLAAYMLVLPSRGLR